MAWRLWALYHLCGLCGALGELILNASVPARPRVQAALPPGTSVADAAPVDPVFQALRDRYGQPETGAEDPFHVLIATILSHRTNDDVTLPAATGLLAAYPTPEALAQADPDRVQDLIEGVGFYRNKAEATEQALSGLLDDRQKLSVNELFVRFGREICRPIGPKCGDCPVAELCPSAEDRRPEGLGEPEGPTMLSQITAGR